MPPPLAPKRPQIQRFHGDDRVDEWAWLRDDTRAEPEVVGHALGVDHLLPDGGIRGAAADGEVVALHDHPPAGHAALADDEVGGGQLGEAPVVAVDGPPGDLARLAPRALVEQQRDPLARGQLVPGVLGFDLGRAAPELELLAAAMQVLGQRAQKTRGHGVSGHGGSEVTSKKWEVLLPTLPR